MFYLKNEDDRFDQFKVRSKFGQLLRKKYADIKNIYKIYRHIKNIYKIYIFSL